MALEIEAKLVKLLPILTGEGKNGTWTKQDFVVETFGEYPKKICFEAWGDKATEIQQLPIGSVVKISFSAESREYNDKWFTSLRCYKIGNAGLTTTTQEQSQTTTTETSTSTNVTTPSQENSDNSEEEEDDLPF